MSALTNFKRCSCCEKLIRIEDIGIVSDKLIACKICSKTVQKEMLDERIHDKKLVG